MEDILNENLIDDVSESEANETALKAEQDEADVNSELVEENEAAVDEFENEEPESEEAEDEAEEEEETEDETEEEEEAEIEEDGEEAEAEEEEDNGVIDEFSDESDESGAVTEEPAFSEAKAELSSMINAIEEDKNSDGASEEAENAEGKAEKVKFKLTAPENLQSILQSVCAKRGRKLIYSPKEVIFEGTYKVLGTDKKNEEGIKVKDIIDAEIKEGVRLGYLDRFDGLKTSEIKEEYENDIVYEFAEQEFKKTGLVLDGSTVKVYIYDWDLSACHHVGYLDEEETLDLVPYLQNSENFSFDIYGIITGGKGKRVTKDENGKITVTKEKDGNIGIELDVSILKRKD